MRKVRIMWLASRKPCLPVMGGIKLEIVEAVGRRWSNDFDHPNSDEVAAVRRAITEGRVDLVIICDNRGAGQQFAEATARVVPTIVFWTRKLRAGDVEPYRRFGIRHFCKEKELGGKIVEVVARLP